MPHDLVDSLTASLRVPKGKRFVFERKLSGFGLRRYPSGHHAFVVCTTVASAAAKSGRATRWKTIGDATGPRALPVPEARRRATAVLAELQASGAATHDLTLRAAIAKYEATERLSAKTRYDVAHALRKHCGDWLDTRLVEISKADVRQRYAEILPPAYAYELAEREGKEEPSPVRANFVMSAFRSVWSHAIKEITFAGGQPVCPTSILDGERKPNPVRTRYLDDSALRALGEKLRLPQRSGTVATGAYSAYLLVLLLNGMRASEPAKLMWAKVGADSIKLSAWRLKQRRDLEVPLTTANAAIIEHMRELRGKLGPPDYVFASEVTKAEMRCAKYIAALLLPRGYALHDLRRTFKRHCRQLDVPEYVSEALIGHVAVKNRGDMSARYDGLTLADRHAYLEVVQTKLIEKIGGLDGVLPVDVSACR